MESTAAPPRRIAPAWIGPGLLVLWLGAMVPALARLETGAVRASPVSEADALLTALRGQVDLERHHGAAVVFHLPVACTCDDREDTRQVRDALRARGIRWVELAGVASTDLPHSLIALDAEGRLRYAGPMRPDGLCAGTATAPLATRYLSFHREDAPRALVSGSRCPCR
ncbi:hypothetical protein [Pseudoxanthomonas sp. PXM04]|jgi:hypothetical protein|uniref:hypothetical protein n=1 Tax=Pseudoxanthomonas sp. PXM04 TaxID=2769297 RepID=UPI00177EBDCD|nr:hypothetical protein [Pseudoxanthomonas sp. PXM04]MBD9379557.1 hypothetical protein [Pseudoxanthomonas sp. PXM04]UBB24709.1 hypothetical protein LAG73_15310 [Pseudoxanthomonas japonensis]